MIKFAVSLVVVAFVLAPYHLVAGDCGSTAEEGLQSIINPNTMRLFKYCGKLVDLNCSVTVSAVPSIENSIVAMNRTEGENVEANTYWSNSINITSWKEVSEANCKLNNIVRGYSGLNTSVKVYHDASQSIVKSFENLLRDLMNGTLGTYDISAPTEAVNTVNKWLYTQLTSFTDGGNYSYPSNYLANDKERVAFIYTMKFEALYPTESSPTSGTMNFTACDGTTREVPSMIFEGSFKYCTNENMTAVQVPLINDYSKLYIIPKDSTGEGLRVTSINLASQNALEALLDCLNFTNLTLEAPVVQMDSQIRTSKLYNEVHESDRNFVMNITYSGIIEGSGNATMQSYVGVSVNDSVPDSTTSEASSSTSTVHISLDYSHLSILIENKSKFAIGVTINRGVPQPAE